VDARVPLEDAAKKQLQNVARLPVVFHTSR